MSDKVASPLFLSTIKKYTNSLRGLAILAGNRSELVLNPHPVFHQARSINPVLWVPPLRLWFVTGYDEVTELLRSSNVGWGTPPYREGDTRLFADLHLVEQVQSKWLLFQDTPHHTKLRALIHQAFSHWSITDLRPIIQDIADNLLDQLQAQHEADLISGFAQPLPLLLIMNLMSLPAKDYEKLSGWIHAQSATLEVSRNDRILAQGNEATIQLMRYFQGLIDQRRVQPNDDLISLLTQVEDNGVSLDDETIAANLIMLFVASYENVKNAIGLCVWSLFQHPDQWQSIRTKPEILPEAIEELLRFETPAVMVYRRALTDFQLSGSNIKKGQGLAIVLTAANRDPKRFVEPDRLDFNRQQYGVPFGAGIHTCLGAQLARQELQIALETLFHRMPNLQPLTTEADWLKKIAFRGLKTLPVSLA